MSRREFSRKVKAEIWKRANGHCENCQAVLKPGEGDCDHIQPEGLVTEEQRQEPLTAEHGQWLCNLCHPKKTRNDVRMMRKADRQRDKASGAYLKTKRPIEGRGFEPTEKDPDRNRRDPFEGLPKSRLYT